MATKLDAAQSAAEIIRHIGGEDNVKSVYHCATRLRFTLHDAGRADKAAIERVPGVISVVEGAGQWQVVIGAKVADFYRELLKIREFPMGDGASGKEPFLTRAIALISGLFQPIIPALAGAGLIKGLIAVGLVSGLLNPNTTTYMMVNVAADGVFFFLPVFLALTAARKFQTSEMLALAIAVALCHPSVEILYWAINADSSAAGFAGVHEALKHYDFLGVKGMLEHYGYPDNFQNGLQWMGFGFQLMHYGYSVIPIVFAVWVLSYVEKWVYRFCPDNLRILVAPAVILLFMVPFTFLAVGPIGGYIGIGIAKIMLIIHEFSAVLFGAVVGFIWQILVIFGVHWSTMPVTFSNYAQFGYDFLQPITSVGVMGQVGAAFAVALKTRNHMMRGLGISTGITGALGITEPLLYGVTLKLKKPFLCGCIGGAVGGALAGLVHTVTYAYAFGGLLALPSYIGEGHWLNFWVGGIGAMAVAAGTAFVLVWVLGFDDIAQTASAPDTSAKVVPQGATVLVSPMQGEVMPLEKMNDAAFAGGAMGQGMAIRPTLGELRAPCDGIVQVVFPTRHVVMMSDAQGAEIMMHIGIDTVEAKGEGFTALVAEGQAVKAGDVLIRFDIEALAAKGYDLTTAVLIANGENYAPLAYQAEAGSISAGEALFTATPKNHS